MRRIDQTAGAVALVLTAAAMIAALTTRAMWAGASTAEIQQHSGQILGLLAVAVISFFAAVYFACRCFGLRRSLAVVVMLSLFGLLTLWLSADMPEPLMKLVLGHPDPVEFKL